MRFFIAGIMQGSLRDTSMHEQDYRSRCKSLLESHYPNADVYDPLENHEESIAYNDETAQNVFYQHNRLCREVDVVVAFVPEASMGTAIEMWEAHEHGRGIVIAISPLEHNWAIRFCSHIVFADVEAFEAAVVAGTLKTQIEQARDQKQRAAIQQTTSQQQVAQQQ